MYTLITGLLIIGLTALLSVSGLCLVRKCVQRETLEACHEVGGVFLAIIGTLYAIVVGLIVVDSQSKVDEAGAMVVKEANMLSNIYHLAQTFKQPARSNIRGHVHDYALAVLNQDWSQVENGAESEATIPPYQHLWRDITSYVPAQQNDGQAYAVMLTNIEDLSSARKYRMVTARSGLSLVLWAVLIGGGLLVILFTYFFFLENLRAQMLMTSFVAISLSMNVYLIYICQNPYHAELGVKNRGFGYSFNPNWFVENEQEKQN